MGLIPPPPPLSREQFYKAISEGKKTLKEIDPEFWRWYAQTSNYLKFGWIVIAIGAIVFLVTFLSMAFSGLSGP